MATGIGESLWHELSPIGVKALTVVPGYFRTSFLKDGNVNMIESKIPEYKELNDKALGALNAYNGHQPGDPQKGVARIIDVVRQEGAAEGRGIPQRLFLGSDSVRDIGRQLKNVLQLLEEWKDFAESTDLPKGT